MKKTRFRSTIAWVLMIFIFVSNAAFADKPNLSAKDSLKIEMAEQIYLGESIVGKLKVPEQSSNIVTVKLTSEDGSQLLNVDEFRFSGSVKEFKLDYGDEVTQGMYMARFVYEDQVVIKRFKILKKDSSNNNNNNNNHNNNNNNNNYDDRDDSRDTSKSKTETKKDEVVKRNNLKEDIRDAKNLDDTQKAIKSVRAKLKEGSISLDEAKILVNETFKDIVGQKTYSDIKSKDKLDLNSDIRQMIRQTIKQAGKVNIANKVQEKGDILEFKIESKDLEKAIQNTLKTSIELKAMDSSAEKSLSKDIKPTVMLDMGVIDTNKKVDIKLDKTLNLADAGVDVEIKMYNMTMVFSEKLLSKTKTEDLILSFTAADKVLKDSIEKNRGSKKSTGIVNSIKLELGNKELDQSEMPEIAISISDIDLNAFDADKLGIFVFDEKTGKFEFIKSKLVEGNLVFTPPHFSTYTVMENNVTFGDLDKHWAKNDIEILAAKGIVGGKDGNKFDPNSQITRAEFLTILVNALDLKADAKASFKDVDANAWYYEAVSAAEKNGITTGDEKGNFNPNSTITRQDMAVMIARAFEASNGEALLGDAVSFEDTKGIASYAKSAVEGAAYYKIISGYTDNSFRPTANATRAEAGKMILNLIK